MTSHDAGDVTERYVTSHPTPASVGEDVRSQFSIFLRVPQVIGTMASGGKAPEKGESSTEAYEEMMEARSGACAADYWAGPGVNRPATDGRGIDGWKSPPSTSEKLLKKRVRNLERSIRKKEMRESRGKSKKSGKPKKDSPPGSPDDSGDCDSGDSSSDISREASRSSSSSSSDVATHSSPEKKKKGTKKRRTKYDRKHQLKGKPMKNADTILVCLIRLLKRCYRRGRRVEGLIDHLLVMAEKAETGMYKLDCLIGYDDECRENANEKGLKSFGKIEAATVLRFLSYDSTAAAKRQGAQAVQPQAKRSGLKGYCFSFNSQGGCDGAGCNFKHICMFCGESNHGATGCKRGKGAGGRSNKGN